MREACNNFVDLDIAILSLYGLWLLLPAIKVALGGSLEHPAHDSSPLN